MDEIKIGDLIYIKNKKYIVINNENSTVLKIKSYFFWVRWFLKIKRFFKKFRKRTEEKLPEESSPI
jgi:hypothetical protein